MFLSVRPESEVSVVYVPNERHQFRDQLTYEGSLSWVLCGLRLGDRFEGWGEDTTWRYSDRMPLPRPAEARRYYRAAKQRSDEANLLLEAGRTTGAVYLAGYTVECFLKALILASVSAKRRTEILAEFRGSRAHNLEWLGAVYRHETGAVVPRTVTRHLARVASWSTDLRYTTVILRRRDAEEFMESVTAVADWADGRM